MYNKYVKATPGTKEFEFYNFLAAFLSQDVRSFKKGVNHYKRKSDKHSKALLVAAIDDFFELKYSEEEKAEFVSWLSSGHIGVSETNEKLTFIRDLLSKKV